jgi:hypothetical protein
MGHRNLDQDKVICAAVQTLKAQQQNNTNGYNTQNAASKAVLTGLNPKSIKENTEYAGLIYKDKNGLYRYTNPNGGNGDSSPVGSAPAGTTVYGDRIPTVTTRALGHATPPYGLTPRMIAITVTIFSRRYAAKS